MKRRRIEILFSIFLIIIFVVILPKEKRSLVNVLIMGIGGGDHPGADLTDTMMVLTLNQNRNTIGITSLPRDIWSDTLKDKINSAYHYGDLALSKTIASEVVGFPIQNGVIFDFSGFVNIIDVVGGIEINIPVSFTDPQYPIAGKENDPCMACRYESLRFEAGIQTMDGIRALQYIRSRHAQGDEGTDFARSRRQQEVLVALKEKLISKEVLLNPFLYKKLFDAFHESTDTDMNMKEYFIIGKLFASVPKDHIVGISIEDLLYAPPQSLYGRYVLTPKISWEDIHRYIKSKLESQSQ